MEFHVVSPAFPNRAPIPRHYTCDGADVSPPLQFQDIPPSARTLVLLVEDPDAPDPRRPVKTWVHWVAYDIPADIRGLAEGASKHMPDGARAGLNDWKRTGWGGPCPPAGNHRYFFRVYALDTELGDLGTPTKDELLRAMRGHVVGEAEWMGTYTR
jgi:Raf kinase inhibitor-like YbhB/YbcL family protein